MTNPVEQDGVVVPFVLVMRSGVSSTNDMEYGRFKEYELAMAVGRLLLEADALCHPEWCGFEVISPEQAAAPAPEAQAPDRVVPTKNMALVALGYLQSKAYGDSEVVRADRAKAFALVEQFIAATPQAPAAGVLCSACDGEGHTPDSNACDYCDATGVFARTPQPEALGELPEPAVHWTEPLPLRDGGAVAAATYYTTDQMRERDRKWIAAIALASRPRVDEAMVERACNAYNDAAVAEGFTRATESSFDLMRGWMELALRAALGVRNG